jgi:midasin
MASLLPVMHKYFHISKDVVDRYLVVHRETCKMSYILTKCFAQIASEGFCSPAEASMDLSFQGPR